MTAIALPSGKSLGEKTMRLFEDARICFDMMDGSNTSLLSGIAWPTVATFVKPSRIPKLVESGEFELGITGLDVVRETGARVKVCADLQYNRGTNGKASVVLFGPNDRNAKGGTDIPDGVTVLSEYPRLTRAFFKRLGRRVRVVKSPGSAEAEVPDIHPFGVCLSETGRSLQANSLRIIAVLLESSATLIANKKAYRDEKTRERILAFRSILLGVLEARDKVMLVMNVPSERLGDVLGVTPALRSPTVTPLAGSSPFLSVSSVVHCSRVNHVATECIRRGAEGVIIMPISSAIPSW
ncbi:MAG: ATP phosphoribosyltransferase [Patescibacteria group bacterium]|nr:ATP phosphoribosyltransferase [Patescibacteria group bacterium]